MAITTPTATKYYKAHWTRMDGKQRSQMTKHRDFMRAIKQANELEAIDHFKDQADAKVFDFMAANGLGANEMFDCFTHKAHITKDKFKKLLNEAKVDIPTQSRRKYQSTLSQGRNKRYRWKKKLLHLDDIIRLEGCDLNYNTVMARMSRGWTLEQAVRLPKDSKIEMN